MKVSKEPLWAAESEELLGYSYSVTVPMYELASKLYSKYYLDEYKARMGINHHSQGVTWDKDLVKRVYIFEWFQPLFYQ